MLLKGRERDPEAARNDGRALAVKEREHASTELPKHRSEQREMKERLALLPSGKGAKDGDTGLPAADLRSQITLAERMEKVLVKDVDRLDKVAKSVNLKKLDLEEYTAELEEAQQMFSKLSQRAELLLIEAEAPARVTRLQDGAASEAPPTLWERLTGAGRPRR